MIIDAHCHAWNFWPYQPQVPNPLSRSTIDQLLFEMDQNGVGAATVVCARIDHNPYNNDYVFEAIQRWPGRFVQFADVDCSWTTTYHTPGAAQRLQESIQRFGLCGFTHYVRSDDDGAWFLSEEGQAFFRVAERYRQIASLSISPRFQPTLRLLAERFPGVVFLCHHLSGVRVDTPGRAGGLDLLLASAPLANIYVKISGYHYASPVAYDYPYLDCQSIIRAIYEHFGAQRMCWGSDYPVVSKDMTYQQALEALRTHAPFIPSADKMAILGGTLEGLLAERGHRPAGQDTATEASNAG